MSFAIAHPKLVSRDEAPGTATASELDLFFDEAIVAMITLDLTGRITWANRAALQVFGVSRDELVGLDLARACVAAEAAGELVRRLERGDQVRDHELVLAGNDGATSYVAVTGAARLEGGDRTARCFVRDITERKLADHDRDMVIADLTRTVRLSEMFASVLGHDLRNPLQAIVIAGQLIASRATGALETRAAQRLIGSATRMGRMIDQLLDFSRARMGGGISLERKPLDLVTAAREVIEELRAAFPDRTVLLTPVGSLDGEWDPVRIAQVLSNLVGNAIRHGTPDVPIEVHLDGITSDIVRIRIANGGAISKELLPILFAPFRGSHQRNAKSQGLGLGLFITDHIVRAHGGTIRVTSEHDRTELAIDLPRRQRASAAPTFDAHVRSHDTSGAFPVVARTPTAVSDDTLGQLVSSLRDYAIFMIDPHGYVLTWNLGAQLIKGYSAEDIIGRHFSIFYPRAEIKAGKCERELALAERDGQYSETSWRLRKDGTPFWASVLITALRDPTGKLLGFAKVTRDLTEQLLAKEVERQSEEKFRVLVEGVKEYAICMLDPEGNVTTWNAGAERIKGYRAAEIIGKHFSAFYTEEDLRAGKTDHELEVAIRDGRFEDEGWRVRKDGSRFWANVVVTALHDYRGSLLGFAKVTRDLTEQRNHELERLRLAQAQESVRLRDEFLSIASHELKTPLTVLRMQLESLTRRLGEVDPTLVPKLQRTQRAGERLGEVVETLLDVSRIAGGRFELRDEPVELAELVSEVVDRLRETAETARCELRVSAPAPLWGSWDRARLDQLVANLLSNAIKYAAGSPIDVAVRADGDHAVLEVRDRGPGLPEGRESQLFDRFERATSMRNYGGLGLGLYLVREIAEAHGGTAIATNAIEGGACFRVVLPTHPGL